MVLSTMQRQKENSFDKSAPLTAPATIQKRSQTRSSQLLDQRALFDLPEEVTYLNCAYISPQLKSVSQAGRLALEAKQHPWTVTVNDFFEPVEQARDLFGQLIKAPADSVAIIPSVSYGMALAAKNLKPKPSGEVLVLKDQFPSHVYIWQKWAKAHNQSFKMISPLPGQSLSEALIESINEKTSLIACPHVLWTNGRRVDLEQIAIKRQEFKAQLVIDGTQSVGAFDFSWERIQPDFLVTASYKWLLGPYALGFLVAHQKHWQGEPLEENWINRKNSSDFSKLTDYQPEYQIGARRFDMGEKSQFLQMPMVIAALKQILAWGIPSIESTLKAHNFYLAQRLSEFGFEVPPDSEQAPHMIGFYHKAIPSDLVDHLKAERIFVSQRGSSLRVAPHVYNTQEDLDRFISEVKKHLS